MFWATVKWKGAAVNPKFKSRVHISQAPCILISIPKIQKHMYVRLWDRVYEIKVLTGQLHYYDEVITILQDCKEEEHRKD